MSIEKASPLNVDEIRDDFPILDREVKGKDLVYLDNAATSQNPQRVIDAMTEYYEEYNSNVDRGMHTLSQEASIAYEEAREKVAEFIGADTEELVFTSNTTEAMNTVAYGWGLKNLSEGDEIVMTQMEHHSSLVTWQQIAKKTGAELRYIEVENGTLNEESIDECINEDTAIVSLIHMSNVFGTITPAKEIAERAHEVGAKLVLDGAQSVPHTPIDVKEIDCDFLAFSGHKMCGPTGSGGLYAKRELLEEMEPYRYGGGMIKKVSYDESTWDEIPGKFEAGTPNIAEAIGLGEAVEYLEDIGLEKVHKHEKQVTKYALELLEEVDEVELYGPGPGYDERGGVISFNVSDAHSHDTSEILNESGVATRSGHHCAQPLMKEMGIPSTTRASFYLYNTKEEAEKLVESIDDVVEVFGR